MKYYKIKKKGYTKGDIIKSNQLTRTKNRMLRKKDKDIIDFVKMQNQFFPNQIDD